MDRLDDPPPHPRYWLTRWARVAVASIATVGTTARRVSSAAGCPTVSANWGTLWSHMRACAGRSRSALGVLGCLSLALLMAGCGGGSPMPAASRHVTSTTGRTVILTTEKVTISPWTGLQNGQQVTVKVQGFKPGEPEIKFFLSECQSPLQVNRQGCGKQLAAQSFGLTDSSGNGSGTVSFTVESRAATQSLGSVLVPCSGTCVIVATTGEGAGDTFGFAPIAFAGE